MGVVVVTEVLDAMGVVVVTEGAGYDGGGGGGDRGRWR